MCAAAGIAGCSPSYDLAFRYEQDSALTVIAPMCEGDRLREVRVLIFERGSIEEEDVLRFYPTAQEAITGEMEIGDEGGAEPGIQDILDRVGREFLVYGIT